MNLYSSKIKILNYLILSAFAFFINYFFSNLGVYPIDTFSSFDAGYLITKGYHPIKDFWVISGVFIDYLQALCFLIFGFNWNAYIFHASFLNAILSVFFLFFLNNINSNFYLNFCLAASLATLCYPVSGTPFPYLHSYILSLISIMIFYLAVYKEEKIYWMILPFFMLFAFLSMQLPSGLINFLILTFTIIYYIKIKRDFIFSFLSGTSVCLILIIVYFLLLKIDLKDAFIQLILFPLTIGESRIVGDESAYASANLIKKLTIRGTLGHFKFINIFLFANFIAIIFFIKKNSRKWFEKKLLLNIFVFLCGLSFIFHQLITANQTFIFSLIPILCGLHIVQLNDFFKIKSKRINIFLLLIIVFVTVKYHNVYNVKRKFMDLQNVNLNNAVKAEILNNKFNKLQWITPYHYKENPKEELRLLKEAVSIISNENVNNFILITHYQFFSILTEKKINILNRWYFPNNNTHPTNSNNSYYSYYNHKINKLINKKKIKKIYLAKSYPREFWFINFEDLLEGYCFKKIKHNDILHSININNCN